jgi:hypothetical protein
MLAASNFTLYTRPKAVRAKRGRLGRAGACGQRWPSCAARLGWEVKRAKRTQSGGTGSGTMDSQGCREITPYGVTTNRLNVRNEPNWPAGEAKDKCFHERELCRIRPGGGDGKAKPIPRRPRPFPSRRGLASFCTIAVALVSLWADNPAGADAPKTAGSEDHGSEYRLQAEDRVNAGLQTDKASDAGTMK